MSLCRCSRIIPPKMAACWSCEAESSGSEMRVMLAVFVKPMTAPQLHAALTTKAT